MRLSWSQLFICITTSITTHGVGEGATATSSVTTPRCSEVLQECWQVKGLGRQCDLCEGKQQRRLQAAICTENDIKTYCGGGGAARPALLFATPSAGGSGAPPWANFVALDYMKGLYNKSAADGGFEVDFTESLNDMTPSRLQQSGLPTQRVPGVPQDPFAPPSGPRAPSLDSLKRTENPPGTP